MRAGIVSFVAIAAVIGTIAPVQAGPTALPREAVTDPAITLVWQRCGHGYHRGNRAWQDKTGAWHGPCVPNRPGAAASPPPGGMTTAEQLNQQEMMRLQGGPPAPQPYPGPPLGGHGGHAQ
jgi:hypothetical protein